MVDVKRTIKCSLCDSTSDDVMVMSGFFNNNTMFICIECIAEFIDEINIDKKKLDKRR